MYINMYVRFYLYIYIYINIYLGGLELRYIRVCVCVCVYIYISHYSCLTLLMVLHIIFRMKEMKQAIAFHAILKL
jgi:hypothetical protein